MAESKKTYTFGEKTKESIYDKEAKAYKECEVWKTPKYEQSKKKAIELIDKGGYGLCEGDFWILMNATKSGKMSYTGLIISHNACLKINDKMPDKFKPESVIVDKDGYNGSLVFTYSNSEQFIYEVGEVSGKNCKNDYPYAMGFKRLFDRVVLKLSKIAFEGIYSETESDEFKSQNEDAKPEKQKKQTTATKPSMDDVTMFKELQACKTIAEVKTYYANNKSKSGNPEGLKELANTMILQFKKESEKKEDEWCIKN